MTKYNQRVAQKIEGVANSRLAPSIVELSGLANVLRIAPFQQTLLVLVS